MTKVVDVVVDSANLSTTKKLAEIGSRMKAARESVGLSRPSFTAKFGGSVRTLENNEAGRNEPGAGIVLSFISLGINANWLLTGEGPMLLSALTALPAQSQSMTSQPDLARLRLSLQAVDEGLAATSRSMASDQKAELVMAVYDLLEEPGVNKERVLKLVKLAA
jgi:transcriptional regulator with XRE-family HTH domain